MRYINQGQHWLTRVNAYKGKPVETTDGRRGIVVDAAYAGSKIVLYVQPEHGEQFMTDNEHATIVREA